MTEYNVDWGHLHDHNKDLTSNHRPYVVNYGDQAGVHICGPFSTHDEAGEWGEKWQEENGDNPCWFTVGLTDEYIAKSFTPGFISAP